MTLVPTTPTARGCAASAETPACAALGLELPPIRLVALDLDGTILERGQQIQPALVQALRELGPRGIRSTAATGRPLGFQLALLQQHGLGPAAAAPSALMVDERELYLLTASVLTQPTTDLATGSSCYQPHTAWNTCLRQRWETLHPLAMHWLQRAREEAAGRGWPAADHLPESEAAARGLPTLEFQEIGHAVTICIWLAARLAAVAPDLACNRNARLVQIHDARAGKGLALAELARLWEIRPEQVLAIGDSHNDLSMLDAPRGFQVATVGNADEHVKTLVAQRRGYVAAGVAGAGVLEALAAYGVRKEQHA